MPPIPSVQVFRSGIHGYGVRATRDFAKGDVVVECDGVTYEEADLEDDTYALWIDDGIYFDLVDQTRWVNHCCDPNAEVEADVDPATGLAWARLVAIRPIMAGQEITYDYGFSLEQAEPCSCGAAGCRGLIVDPRELPPHGPAAEASTGARAAE